MSEKHELEDRYDHNIKWQREQWKDSAKWGYILGAVCILLLPLLAKSILFIFLLILPLSISVTMFSQGLPYLLEARRFEKFKVIALSYPAHVSNEVGNAYNNVSPWLVNPKEQGFDPKLLARLCARYVELEKLSTDELRQKLDDGGVWSPQNSWFGIGRTLDEGLMMAIYTRRGDKESVALEATMATHMALSLQAATAPDLQMRKWTEQQKEAVALEIDELKKESDHFQDWDLDELEGSARLHLRGEEVVRVTFTLPSGLYNLRLTDSAGKKSQKFLRINGAPKDFELTPPIKTGHIFITNETGTSEIIGLD